MSSNTLSIMTFNVGLAGWKVLGKQIDIVPETESRYKKVIDFLFDSESTHDVVCLQEVFGEYRDRLLEDIAAHFPHTFTHSTPTTGLCIISKYPITQSRDGRYPTHNQLGTDILFPKGYMGVVISGNLVINAQASVGGGIPSTSAYVEWVREKQIGELLAFADNVPLSGPHMRILCGDFNCGPEQSYDNYLQLSNHGYDVGRVDPCVTWDKNNPMIGDSIISKIFFSEDVSQRCDLIFARGECGDKTFTPKATYVVHQNNELSDHYAVACVLSHPY